MKRILSSPSVTFPGKIEDTPDDYVHDHPWQAVGVAAGVGLLIGLLLNRK